MGLINRMKMRQLEKNLAAMGIVPTATLEEMTETIRKQNEALNASKENDIEVLTKRDSASEEDIKYNWVPYDNVPDDEIVLIRDKREASVWGYDKCPRCGIYGAVGVKKCICGYKFKNI